MPDLTFEAVRERLEARGLTVADDEELEEITHRINALNEAVSALEHASLDAAAPFAPSDLEQL